MVRATTAQGGRVQRTLLVGTVVVMAVFVAVFALGRLTPLPQLKALVDIGGEGNVPTWWNASLLLLVAVGAVVSRAVTPARAVRRAWAVVAVAATYLSLDEACMLHERMGAPVRELGIEVPTYAWVVPGAVLAVGGAAVLVLAGRRLPRAVARRLALALGTYFLGAIVVEAFTGLVSQDGHGMAFTVGIMVEELLEMGACILAVTALVDHLVTTRRPLAPGERLA